jgi:fructosamine-3-kinase
MIPELIHAYIEQETGGRIRSAQPVSGGCIHHAHKVETTAGDFFVKWNKASQFDNFSAEAGGLKLLGSRSDFHIPKVHSVQRLDPYAFILMEYIQQGRRANDYHTQFGTSLAILHRISQPYFGLDHSNFIGSLPQRNGPHKAWADFFISERLSPQLKMAVDSGKLETGLVAEFDELYNRIGSIFPEEPPALLHGDLWGGNVLIGMDGHAALIDPAVYYGHREMELAFMQLFDSHPQAFFDAYESIYPLGNGWRSRTDLCNLYPLLVHVNLFGGSYVGAVKAVLRNWR